MTKTHSEAILELSAVAFEEIRHKLKKAGYLHLIHDDIEGGWISLDGIRVRSEIDCIESRKLTMGQRAEAKWSADIERIEDHILASKDECARFKWQHLVSQEIGMCIRIAEAVEPHEFDSLCSARGFDGPMKDYLREMLIFLGLGQRLAEVPIEDGAFQITVNGRKVAVKTLKPSADEVIRACGPGYSEAHYYRVIETLLVKDDLSKSTQKTYGGNMVIDYKAQANYTVLRRDQSLPPHLQLKSPLDADQYPAYLSEHALRATAATSSQPTQLEVGVLKASLLDCPYCQQHRSDVGVSQSAAIIDIGVFCKSTGQEHIKTYPAIDVESLSSDQVRNLVIDQVLLPVFSDLYTALTIMGFEARKTVEEDYTACRQYGIFVTQEREEIVKELVTRLLGLRLLDWAFKKDGKEKIILIYGCENYPCGQVPCTVTEQLEKALHLDTPNA